jgi:transposase
MTIRYRVDLSETERCELQAMLSGGKHAARTLERAQILLAADAGVCDEIIATTVVVGASTVYRTKRRFVEGNLERALREEPRPGAACKLSGKDEALRHAFATHRHAGGTDLRVLQELLGHAGIETTQVYTHLDTSRLHQMVQSLHPLTEEQQD